MPLLFARLDIDRYTHGSSRAKQSLRQHWDRLIGLFLVGDSQRSAADMYLFWFDIPIRGVELISESEGKREAKRDASMACETSRQPENTLF